MSFISGAVRFLASPIIDLAQSSQIVAKQSIEKEAKLLKEERESLLSNHFNKTLSSQAESKIKAFLKELGHDVDKVYLRIDEQRSGGKVCHSLSTKVHGYCLLLFSPDLVKEIEENFTDGHQFYLAHEMAHDVLEDEVHFIQKDSSSSKFKVCAYLTSMVAINYFFPGSSYLAYGLKHIVSVSLSKFLGRHNDFLAQRKHEKACDLKAVSDRPHLAQAGIKELELVRQLRLKLKAQNHPGAHSISDDGENITDFKHPKTSERIKYLQVEIDNHKK